MIPISILAIPRDSVNDATAIIVSLGKDDGRFVTPGDTVLEYETSKAVHCLVAENPGYVAYCVRVQEDVKIGTIVAGIFAEWDEEAVAAWKHSNLNLNELGGDSKLSRVHSRITEYSMRANDLIQQHSVDRKLFGGFDFVSAIDVEKVLGRQVKASPQNRVLNLLGSAPKDRERVVVVCANRISADMVNDIFKQNDSQTIVGYVVDASYRNQADLPYFNSDVFEFPEKISRNEFDSAIIAMGGSLKSMRFRKKIFEYYQSMGIQFTNIISQSANISSGVQIGCGNLIEANVYIGPHTRIGDNNFLSYNSVIGHHNTIGSHNLFGPGVTMAGLVSVGDDCILPTGVNFIDRIEIGHRVILPVGFNVISNLQDDAVVKINAAGLH